MTEGRRRTRLRHIPGVAATVGSALLVTAATLTVGGASPQNGRWRTVDVGELRVAGDGSTDRLFDAAFRLTRARRLLGAVLPDVRLTSPAVMIVSPCSGPLSGQRDFVEGRVMSYAVTGCDGPALDQSILEASLRQVLRRSQESLPLWIEVGVARHVSAAVADPHEPAVTLGTPLAGDLVVLRSGFAPIRDIFSASRESRRWTDEHLRRTFVAQSWLYVQYLLSEQNRRGSLTRVVRARAAGDDPTQALEAGLGRDLDTFHQDVVAYYGRSIFLKRTERIGDAAGAPSGDARPVDDADVEALIGHVLAHRRRLAEAAVWLQAATRRQPQSPALWAALGRVRSEQGRREEALGLFRRAAGSPMASLDRYYYAAALLAPAMGRTDARPATPGEAALAESLLQGAPGGGTGADALFLLGLAQLHADNPGAAIQSAVDAFGQWPNHEYALLLGRAYAADNDPAAARQILEPLADRGDTADIRRASRKLLDGLPMASAGRPRSHTVFRTLREGERRTTGQLVRIECAGDWVFLHVRREGDAVRFASTRLDLIELLVYGGAPLQGIQCGDRKEPESIRVIWREAPTAPSLSLGIVSVVEFVPPQARP